MKIKLTKADDAFHFKAFNETGKSINIDASPDIGGTNKGVRPMEMLLMALAGCSGIDINLILKKQRQVIENFDILVEGDREQEKEASLFKKIHVRFLFYGKLDEAKVKRAVSLSMDKYCSVSKTLEKTAEITYSIELNETLL